MRSLRVLTGVLGVAVALALAGCGQSDVPQASLEISSVPAAEIYVDGVGHGMSPATIPLGAGDHSVELRLDKFESFETHVTLAASETQAIDAVLTAQDPSDPVVIAKLAEAEGVDVAPFVAPEITRGSSRRQAVAILLWPGKDVRKEGLVNYAIEADETYGGDATLEFRHGRTVLYREPFNPETVTTVRSIPAEVLEHVRVGHKIKWGLYFEDRRRPITSEFRVVQRPKAERQLERVAKSRHMARQPELTQQIMRATILENNRLYTEALVMNLKIAADHEGSTQPYRGIVTTLRRLDAEDSELFALVSPRVGGRGGHSGVSRPEISGAAAKGGMSIAAWSPRQPSAVAAPAAPAEAGSTPPAQPGTQPDTQPAPTDGATAAPRDGTAETADRLNETLERETRAFEGMREQVEAAQQTATEARQAADLAEQQARTAEEAAAAARQAVEDADEPTREQQEQMFLTGRAAEEAREEAVGARNAADAAERALEQVQNEMAERRARIDELEEELEAGRAGTEQAPRAAQPETDAAALQRNLQDAEQRAGETRAAWEAAQAAFEKAQQEHDGNPSRATMEQLREAEEAMEDAARSAYAAQQELEAAQRAIQEISDQSR